MKLRPLPKTYLLTKPWEYQNVYKAGKRLRGDQFSLIYVVNGKKENRLGISVHGVKRAVRRNRIKRIIREFYRLNRDFLGSGVDIVFAVRGGFALDSLHEVEQAVFNLVKKSSFQEDRAGLRRPLD